MKIDSESAWGLSSSRRDRSKNGVVVTTIDNKNEKRKKEKRSVKYNTSYRLSSKRVNPVMCTATLHLQTLLRAAATDNTFFPLFSPFKFSVPFAIPILWTMGSAASTTTTHVNCTR